MSTMSRRDLLTASAAAVLPLACCSGASSKAGPAGGGSAAGEGRAGCGWFFDERMIAHPHWTERPERLSTIAKRLDEAGLAKQLAPIKALADPLPRVAAVHTRAHIDAIRAIPETGPAAALAVAGALGAVKAACDGSVRRAWCAIRPPGHHAENSGYEEGFCFYCNAAIAARYAQRELGVKRVLIVDWDYHHGNGTEAVFYSDPSVLFFSTHDWRAYPGTGDPTRVGAGAGRGFNINIHMECGSDDDAFCRVFDERLRPAADAFKPELVLISAGFDSKRGDELGCFDLTPCGFSKLTRRVMDIADAHARGRLVSLLEGGYSDRNSERYDGLARSVEAHVATLISGSVQSGV
jgi:acetoin utilization deacetylase AcuC-like enzyme